MSGNMPKVFTNTPTPQKHAFWVTEQELECLRSVWGDIGAGEEIDVDKIPTRLFLCIADKIENLHKTIHGPGDNI